MSAITADYLEYHRDMVRAKDCDPAYHALRYVCDRFELSREQRYWLAFLYGCCYCAPTVFYVYNEFPDFENVSLSRLERWWHSQGRERSVFQSDRRWVRSRNQFTDMVRSYREWTGGLTQHQRFQAFNTGDPRATYDQAFEQCGQIFQMGRFGLFIYLEAVHELTGYPMEPTGLDLAHAESSRNGLAYAIGREDLSTHGSANNRKLTREEMRFLQDEFEALMGLARMWQPEGTHVWSVETSLCAFKKLRLGKRYLGYYIERMRREITAMERSVPEGVCWDVLWQFRQETFEARYLTESLELAA
jgi:hypothetical protein